MSAGGQIIGFQQWCQNPVHEVEGVPQPAVGLMRLFPCDHRMLICNTDAHAFAQLRTALRRPNPPDIFPCPICDFIVRGIAIESL